MRFLRVSERKGKAPSDLLNIECSWCAYCFDEALYVLAWLDDREEADAVVVRAEHEAAVSDMREQMRAV